MDDGILSKALAILDAVASGQYESLRQISIKTKLPKSTVHRIVRQMIATGLLTDANGGYELGNRLFELGSRVPRYQRLRQVAQPAMHRLHQLTGRISHLAVGDGLEVVFLDKLVPLGAPTTPSRLGGRLPAHCTAVGKVLMAAMDDDALGTIMTQPLVGMTKHSITSAQRLYAEIVRVRMSGVAVEREESHPGIGCMAYPIRSGRTTVGAISITLPIEEFDPSRPPGAIRAAAAVASKLVSAEETFLGVRV